MLEPMARRITRTRVGLVMASVTMLAAFAPTQASAATTKLVKDINPGPKGAANSTKLVREIVQGDGDSNVVGLETAGGLVYFSASEPVHGRELWKSGGTTAGTDLVHDIWPNPPNSNPMAITRLGTKVVFFANDGERGIEPWISGGTAATTRLIKDINEGAGDANSEFNAGRVGNRVYFDADDGVKGIEPWRTNGKRKGTKRLKDVNPGANDGSMGPPQELTKLGTTLFFRADDGDHGVELWKRVP